jgi:hypothetical protein
MDELIVVCPHCSVLVLIEQLNCCIFRHAIFKNDFSQVNPHASLDECNKLINNNLVYGCCKPFRVINKNNNYIAIICDYI